MDQSSITHDSFTIRKACGCTIDDLFAAFSERENKRSWYAEAPSHKTIEYDLDFKAGGNEVLEVEMLPSTPIAGAVLKWSSQYAEIQPCERIVFYQTTQLNGKTITTAVITCEFTAADAGSEVVLTHQAAFFEGADGPEMRRMGWEYLLTAMAATLPG